jgi:hypothetical protein
LEQHLKLLDGPLFSAFVGYQPDVHPAHPFPDRVHPMISILPDLG